MRWTIFSCAVALAVIGGTPAATQEPGSRQTREFVAAAGQSDQFETLEAQTALVASEDPRIRAFAEQMIKDHRQTSQALQQATARAGLTPPSMAISDDQGRLLGAIQSLSGPAFDKAYLEQQVLAHRSALVVERAYAASGDDPAVRQVAASSTPIISAHLSMAEQMRTGTGGS